MKKFATILFGLFLMTTLVACDETPQNSNVAVTPSPNVTSTNSESDTIMSNVETTESNVTQSFSTSTDTNSQSTSTQSHVHNYSTTITAPTCRSKGFTQYACNCGHSYIADEKPALNHNYTSEITYATCTSKGYTTYTCTYCKDSYITDETPTLSHNYSKSVTSATCTAQGYTTYTCSVCGDTYKDNYTNGNHNYSISVTPATCSTQGYTTYTCSLCGHCYKDNYTNASHTYTNYKCSTCGTVDKKNTYNYLVLWLKQNGRKVESNYRIELNQNGVTYMLGYSTIYDVIDLFRYEVLEDVTYSTYITLDTYTYNYDADKNQLFGYINPQIYNYDSTVSYSTYDGDLSIKNDVIKCANIDLPDLIDYLDWVLKEYRVGITIADLGFTSWISQY